MHIYMASHTCELQHHIIATLSIYMHPLPFQIATQAMQAHAATSLAKAKDRPHNIAILLFVIYRQIPHAAVMYLHLQQLSLRVQLQHKLMHFLLSTCYRLTFASVAS